MVQKNKAAATEDVEELTSPVTSGFEDYPTYEEYINSSESLDTIPGYALVKPEQLLGEPFVITGIHWRYSDVSDRGYVSLTCVAKDDGAVVINDGSTGIRRQILTYCVQKGWASPIEQEDGSQPDGDSPYEDFDWDLPAEVRFDQNGNRIVSITDVKLHAPRGTRVSEYKWLDESDGREKPGSTWYLA
jgi:hypothetical protein